MCSTRKNMLRSATGAASPPPHIRLYHPDGMVVPAVDVVVLMGRVGAGLWLWAVRRWLVRVGMGKWGGWVICVWWLWTVGVGSVKGWWVSVGWLGDVKVVGNVGWWEG